MSASSAPDHEAGQLLYGARAIGDYLGVSERRALYLCEKQAFPFWRQDRTICAKRSSLQAWMTEREQAARRGGDT